MYLDIAQRRTCHFFDILTLNINLLDDQISYSGHYYPHLSPLCVINVVNATNLNVTRTECNGKYRTNIRACKIEILFLILHSGKLLARHIFRASYAFPVCISFSVYRATTIYSVTNNRGTN